VRGHTTALGNLLRDRTQWVIYLIGASIVAIAYAAIAIPAWHRAATLGDPREITGYSMLGIMLFLAAFNLRKRIPMLPLIRTRWWTFAHICGGILALAVFWLHIERIWPNGTYEQCLAALFYLTSLSGLFGLLVQRLQPSRLTQTGLEVIFERIPNEIARLRNEAETLAVECTRKTRHATLARYFVESLQWYFGAPRFVASYIRGSQTAKFWLEQRFATVRRYLNDDEQQYLLQLEALAEEKSAIDAHYAGQLLLRSWLLVHVPCVAAVLALALWHAILVHIYAV
jgi:hypothetical protein